MHFEEEGISGQEVLLRQYLPQVEFLDSYSPELIATLILEQEPAIKTITSSLEAPIYKTKGQPPERLGDY